MTLGRNTAAALRRYLAPQVSPLSSSTSSVFITVIAGLSAAVLLGQLYRWGWPPWPDAAVFIGLVCAGTAAIAWWMQQRILMRHETHVRRLITRVSTLADGQAAAPLPLLDRDLRALAAAVEQAFAQQATRHEQLVRQHRELQMQLRLADAQRQHAQCTLNAVHDAVLVTDVFNQLTLANDAALQALDLPPDLEPNHPSDQVIDDRRLVDLIKETRETGDTAMRRCVEHRRGEGPDARIFDVSLACVASDECGPQEPDAVVTILRDVTREKEVAELKSDFVSSVSHELRTPLSSIKAYVEMLMDGEARDEQTQCEFYNIIQGEANRLGRLIDNILNISQIESGLVKVHRRHVSLAGLISEVIDVMQPQATAKQVTLRFDSPGAYVQVFADKDMIYQAVLNLVGNAIKYCSPGDEVTVAIEANKAAKTAEISVTDTGVGIGAADLPRIFDKFYRVDDHKKMAKGTGLGLSLVKQIIETVHHGKIEVDSRVGLGSTFTCVLPMAEDE